MIEILFFGRTCREDVWEYDFIMNEVLPIGNEKSVYFLSLDEVRSSKKTFDIFVYSCRDPNNYAWGYMPSYDDILECIQIVNPKIIIQLSDEYEHENLDIHNNLSKYCNLMLRQYNHSELRNEYFLTGILTDENLIHIPLGYLNNTRIKREEILPVRERLYNWSFVGKIKDEQFYYYDNNYSQWMPVTDREKMIQIFSMNIPNYFFCESGISKQELVQIYNNSLFVPCGRGNISLNCFRNYEATICGSIPVVVERFPGEASISFKFLDPPPWIFENSWENAIGRCNNLLNYPDEIQRMQEKNLLWWDTLIDNIRERVKNALFEF